MVAPRESRKMDTAKQRSERFLVALVAVAALGEVALIHVRVRHAVEAGRAHQVGQDARVRTQPEGYAALEAVFRVLPILEYRGVGFLADELHALVVQPALVGRDPINLR
jgi:hypothetical protein